MFKYIFILFFLFVLHSCGIVNKEKVVADENAVLSGPPLAIPPDFDSSIEMPQQNTLENTQLSLENYQKETFEDEQSSNPLSNLETNQVEVYDSQNSMQSFETFDPNRNNVLKTRQIQNNNSVSNRTIRRSTVPSDAYIVNQNRLTRVNKPLTSTEDYFTSSSNVFTNTNNARRQVLIKEEGLTRDEKSMIKDLLDTPEQIDSIKDFEDYSASGESD